ncbi:MAG: glycosyltransferase [Candidatus Brocadiales bacterium]|nr:glycosyltransferase [Candidatus Brocadiales bacterium]
MNILLSYTSIPVTTAVYLEKAMRRICGVITHGPTISKDMLEQWDLLAVEKKVKNLQIPFLNGDMEDVIDQLPEGWEPDVFLYVDTGLFYPLKNMRALNCLKACYLIDSHVAFDLHLKFAENYDIVFAAHKPAVEMFKEKGIENVFWIPPACDPALHEKKAGEKKHDVGFVGSSNPERVHLLNELGQRFNTYYERCFLERMAEVFSQSKIVFNKSIEGGLNMRVFEAMASGSMLLTNEANGSGLQDFFQDRKHLVIYRNENELFELADYYLRNDNEREEIAFEGMSKVLSEHAYSNRVNDMVKIMSTFMG